MSEPLGVEEELPRIRQGHSECDELCDAALLLREVDRPAEAPEAAQVSTGRTLPSAPKPTSRDTAPSRSSADEKGRRAGLRAGVEESLESLDLTPSAPTKFATR